VDEDGVEAQLPADHPETLGLRGRNGGGTPGPGVVRKELQGRAAQGVCPLQRPREPSGDGRMEA
jgi:hypothetical protein